MKRVILLLAVLCFCSSLTSAGEPLTVDQCVQMALKQNPQLAQSRFLKNMAGRDVITAVSNYLPEAGVGLGYNHSVTGPATVKWTDPSTGLIKPTQTAEYTSWSSSAWLGASQTLFQGGYNYFNLKNSLASKKSSGFEYEDIKQQVIFTVMERCYNLLKTERLLEVSQEALKSSEESFKLADARYSVGTAPKSEMLQFKVELENAKLAVIEAQHNLSIASTSLNQVLGTDMDQEIKVVDDVELPELTIGFEDAVQTGAEKNPLLLKSSSDVDGARAYVGMAASSFMPSVIASYRYDWYHKDFKEIKHIRDNNYNWSAGVSLSVPVFQGFSRIAQLDKARLNHKMNQEILDYNRRQVDLEVRQAYFSVQLTKSKIGVSEDAERASDETLRLNKEKYNLGAGTMLDLINAQSSYTKGKSNRIQAQYDYKIAMANLKRTMGNLMP